MPFTPVVLLAFANVDLQRPLRNLENEEAAIEDALRPLVVVGRLEIKTLWNATTKRIVGVFQDEHFHGRIRVFHFGGHASSEDLTLASVERTPSSTAAVTFGNYLGRQPGLSLAFLNACSTQPQVARLRDAGVAAVVSTSRAIEDDVAADFARNFYTEAREYPLLTAFEQAGDATRLIEGGQERGLFAPEATAAEFKEPPWRLTCENNDWRLVEHPMENPNYERQLVEVLSTKASEADTAIQLAKDAGFPVERIPRFSNSYLFWSRICEDARNGMLKGRLQPIINVAAKLFPGEPVFARAKHRP